MCDSQQAAKTDAKSQASDLCPELAKTEDELKLDLGEKNAALQIEIDYVQVKDVEMKDLSLNLLARKFEELKGQLLKMKQITDDGKIKKVEISQLAAEIDDLKRQLQDKNTQIKDLTQLASTKEELLKMQQTGNDSNKMKKAENDPLIEEIADPRGQLQIRKALVEDLCQLASTHGKEKEQLANTIEQLQQQLLKMQQIQASLINNNEANLVRINELTVQLAAQNEEVDRKTKEIEKLKQNLACAQETVSEQMVADAEKSNHSGLCKY